MKYQDIQISDVALRSQFVQYWLNGQYTQAFAIIDNNPQLDSKAFIADCLNLITASILTLEQLYYTNVEDYLVAELQQFNVAINNFRQKNTWSSTTSYVVGNFVVYNSEVYLCFQANTNILPTNTAYWAYIGLKGQDGASTLDVQLKYEWKTNVNYVPKDVVYYIDTLYVSKTNNIAKIPSTSTSDWDIFLEIPKAKIIVSQNPPTGDILYDGVIWWRILTN
jgi:hypothetical protein